MSTSIARENLSITSNSIGGCEILELATHTPLPPSVSVITLSSSRELELSNPINESRSVIARNESSLAPVDAGFGAWSFVRCDAALMLALSLNTDSWELRLW